MKRLSRCILFFIVVSIFCGYIPPHWFLIKESASARSQFNINRYRFDTTITVANGDKKYTCKSEFRIDRKEKTTDIRIVCGDIESNLKFRDSKLISQDIKQQQGLFAKPLLRFIEYESLILPFPISSNTLKGDICRIIPDCWNVDYRRLAGVINYRFFSKENGNYYMIDKEGFLPSSLYIKEKNVEILLKKYHSFSTNIKFPSFIEITVDDTSVKLEIDELEIE